MAAGGAAGAGAGHLAAWTSAGQPRQLLADLWLLMPVICIALVSLGFVFSDYQPYWQHVSNSIDRLLTLVTPLVVLWLALPWLIRPTRFPTARILRGGRVMLDQRNDRWLTHLATGLALLALLFFALTVVRPLDGAYRRLCRYYTIGHIAVYRQSSWRWPMTKPGTDRKWPR
ncbi:MAG: hypothetical protein IPO15_11300 [Anaerolineae bacterium]|uniref:hypothetical protein n=1 Tax=Candidatus Amarolinea dominans TaxID=3140696 RepID=UPI0031349ACD|nr:hypothetical protein [Anaerolineae bacterium]